MGMFHLFDAHKWNYLRGILHVVYTLAASTLRRAPQQPHKGAAKRVRSSETHTPLLRRFPPFGC